MMNFVATATLAISMMASAPEAPQWEKSYGKALEATRADQEPLLVVLDKPGSEKARLESTLLSENEATSDTSKLLSPYHLCHVDVTTDYGQKVAKAFNAKEFPHVAIIDKTGSVVIFRKSGQVTEKEWKEILDSHKSGERPHVVLKPTGEDKPYCPYCQHNQL